MIDNDDCCDVVCDSSFASTWLLMKLLSAAFFLYLTVVSPNSALSRFKLRDFSSSLNDFLSNALSLSFWNMANFSANDFRPSPFVVVAVRPDDGKLSNSKRSVNEIADSFSSSGHVSQQNTPSSSVS